MKIQNKSFRRDINGLRAWAVVAVILYHFRITGFSGGFVGVDVFFVISGFLMTGIIVSGLESSVRSGKGSEFSLINFYLSRAKRIIPALLVLCVFLIIVGWFFLSPKEYRALSVQVITALGFFSNIKFWHEAGYFDAASHEKLLLHTWSLSIEWQFYIILPLMLLTIWRLWPGRKSLSIVVTLGLLLSLLLSIIVSPLYPSEAFYLLPTRAWEMLAGSLVYLLGNQLQLSVRTKRALEGGGFTLIIGSIMLFDASSNWPGWRGLIPVIGTMLILTGARQDSRWTGSSIAQWLGTCSYSLYLWHWPFVVGLAYLQLDNHPGAVASALALTLVIGWLSYQLIETSAHTSLSRMSQWSGGGALLVAILVVTLSSALVRLQQGIPGRLPAQVDAIFNEADNKNPRRDDCHVSGSTPVPECTYGGNQLGAIVIGDSHAASIIRTVEKALPNQKLHVLDWTMSYCPTISGINKSNDTDYHCADFLTKALSDHTNFPSKVPLIIINRTDDYLFGPNELDRVAEASIPNFYISSPYVSRDPEFLKEMREGIISTACEFAKIRPVYMVRPTPEMKVDVPLTMGRALFFQGYLAQVFISLNEYKERHAYSWETQDMAALRCGVKILDPLPFLCNGDRCAGDIDGLPIYYDDDHLNERGGSLLVPMFRPVFENADKKDEVTHEARAHRSGEIKL